MATNDLFSKFMRSYEAHRETEWTLEQYLSKCRDDPMLYAGSAERLLAAIGEPELVDTAKDARLGRIFMNRTIRVYPSFSEFYGMEDTIERIVSFFRHASQGLEEQKQILYLLGPVGGGKSSIAERIKALMEAYPIYVLKAGDEVSPVFESPLAIFDPDIDGPEIEETYGVPRRYLSRLMSPWARKRLDEFGGDVSRFTVAKMMPSRVRQIAISKTEPGDENNQDISSLVGKVDIRKLELLSQNDPDAYSYSGGLNRANQGVLEFVEMFKAPIKMLHPLLTATQEGNYIGTECLIVTKDPDSDWVNIGTYRVMIQDDKRLSVFIEPGKHGDVIRKKYWDKGEACPIAVVVGQAPVLGVVASLSAKDGESELAIAGGRIGRAVKTVRGKHTSLPFPADAELVFEGFMPPLDQESATEGPFGEWPGYYASADRPEPVVHVKAVYHRKDPIILGQPPVKPNYPGRQIKIPRLAGLWDALEGAGVPGVTGVWLLQGGGSRFIPVVSIKQMHAGHAKMAGLVLAGCRPGAYMARMIVVVDDDIDITKPAEVMWAMATRWDPKTQTDIIDGCWTGYIDPYLPPDKRE